MPIITYDNVKSMYLHLSVVSTPQRISAPIRVVSKSGGICWGYLNIVSKSLGLFGIFGTSRSELEEAVKDSYEIFGLKEKEVGETALKKLALGIAAANRYNPSVIGSQ